MSVDSPFGRIALLFNVGEDAFSLVVLTVRASWKFAVALDLLAPAHVARTRNAASFWVIWIGIVIPPEAVARVKVGCQAGSIVGEATKDLRRRIGEGGVWERGWIKAAAHGVCSNDGVLGGGRYDWRLFGSNAEHRKDLSGRMRLVMSRCVSIGWGSHTSFQAEAPEVRAAAEQEESL